MSDLETSAKPTMPLQGQLARVTEMLRRHHLVEDLTHRQTGAHQDVVENLIHRQHLVELQREIDELHPADVARILGPQSAAVVWRTFAQASLEEMAEFAGVPVVNALTDDFHPCQVLADLLTLRELVGDLAGRTLAYVGDGANNMAHSYLLGCATAGMHVRIGTPTTHPPKDGYVTRAAEIAATTGGSVLVTDDPLAAVLGADVVVTDTWVSMGQEAELAERKGEGSPFTKYAVDEDLMAHADPDALFLHCLPAYRGYEVSAEVIDGPRSHVWREAENRLHAQKALLSWLVEHAEAGR